MRVQYDTHLHSEFSMDSTTPVYDQMKRASELGLTGICFTDHIDYGFPVDQCPGYDENPFLFDIENHRKTIELERESFPDLFVGIGVECGLQTDADVVNNNRILAADPHWDEIIGSIHLVDKKDPYAESFWTNQDYHELIKKSFIITLENLELFSDFNILGHLDYVTRYVPADGQYEPLRYQEITDEILRFVIKKEIALEINTGALHKKKDGIINPHPEIVKRYYELGGRLISIGSDAHKTEAMAFGFDSVAEFLTEIGFDTYVTFEKRKGIEHKLV